MKAAAVREALRRWYKTALRAAIYVLFLPPLELFRRLPPHAAAATGGRAGALAAWIVRRHRLRAEANLGRAFPSLSAGERKRIVFANFRHMGRTLGEYLSLTRRDPGLLRSLVEVEGMECLSRARASGRGTVVLTAHLGSWEIAAATVALYVPKLAVVARELYDPRLSKLISRLRAHFNIKTIDVNDTRGILRHLMEGGVLGVLVDQNARRVSSVPIDFFGAPAPTPVGPVKIAARTGSNLIMGFIVRTERGHRLVLEEMASRLNGTPPELQLQRYNRRLEELVRAHPEQWVWVHDRWGGSGASA